MAHGPIWSDSVLPDRIDDVEVDLDVVAAISRFFVRISSVRGRITGKDSAERFSHESAVQSLSPLVGEFSRSTSHG